MIPKSLHEIELGDLRALLGRVREGKTLEFKRDLPRGEKGWKKLAAGVAALANTAGGDFLIGIGERDGMAESVLGIELDGVDAYQQSIENVLGACIEPRIAGIDIKPVACEAGRWAFVIRVPRSWVGPHRSTYDNHFYVRTSASTQPLDVPDLRVAFGLREGGIERIETFRRERLGKLMAGDSPARLLAGAAVVVHLAPLPSFVNRDLIDIVSAVATGSHVPVPPRGMGRYARANLPGLINFLGDDGKGTEGYGQLFRSGAYEGASVTTANVHNTGHYVTNIDLANMVVGSVRRYLALQEHYGFAFPTFVMVSLCDAADLRIRFATEFGSGFYESDPAADALVAFPEFLIENVKVNVPQVLRPLLNIVWNAFGIPECDMYTQLGEWKGN